MHVWCGASHWAGKPSVHHIPTTKAEAIARIDTLYNGGALLFSRASIQEISDQIKKRPKKGEKISVRGLDGATIEWDVVIGDTFPTTKASQEFVMETPQIKYLCVEHLKQQLDWASLHLAFCNLQITHLMTLRDKITKEPLPRPLRSVKQTQHAFRQVLLSWRESEACKRLGAVLGTITSTHEIRKIVAFACGDISSLNFSTRSGHQHALLVSLLDLCHGQNSQTFDGKKGKGLTYTIPCFSQDPVYTKIDRTVLGEYGIHIVDDPEGFLQVDDSSIVFSCAPNVPVKQIIADLARPAVLIWDKVEEETEGMMMMTDPDTSRVVSMIEDYYDEYSFPDDKFFIKNFSNVKIYIRRQA